MVKSPLLIPAGAVSATHTSSNDSPTAPIAQETANTRPSTAAQTLLSSSGPMLPPPNPTPATSPPLPPSSSTSTHTAAVCSTTKTITGTVSSPPSANTPAAEIPALAPSPRTLKLQSQISALQSQIATTQENLDDALAKLQNQLSTNTAKFPAGSASPQNQAETQAEAEAIVKRHIKLLHAYHEIKDVGQGLMGLIADARGVRLKEVMEEMGVEEND